MVHVHTFLCFCEGAHIQGGSDFHELEGGGRSNQKMNDSAAAVSAHSRKNQTQSFLNYAEEA